jgi:hypothetical protein
MKIANKSFENMGRFKHLGVMLTDQNYMHEEMKIRMQCGIADSSLVQNHLLCCLLSKNLKIKIFRTVILPVALCGSCTLGETHIN